MSLQKQILSSALPLTSVVLRAKMCTCPGEGLFIFLVHKEHPSALRDSACPLSWLGSQEQSHELVLTAGQLLTCSSRRKAFNFAVSEVFLPVFLRALIQSLMATGFMPRCPNWVWNYSNWQSLFVCFFHSADLLFLGGLRCVSWVWTGRGCVMGSTLRRATVRATFPPWKLENSYQ